MLAPKCPTFNGRPTFANPMYLKKAQNEHPGLYAITQDQSDPATRLIPDREEILTLAEESRSKLNKDLVKPFDYTKLNSLYEIFKPPAQHYEIQLAQANAIRKKMWRKSFVKTKPNVFKNIDFLPVSKSVSKSRQAYNVMTNNINHLNELVNQAWVKHSNDHLYLRHPTAQDMEILVKKYLKYVESLKDELDELESDKAEFSNMYDMLLQECVSKDVITSNANAVSATCGKCVFNSNHDACVSKFLNDMNARTKKPNVVPINCTFILYIVDSGMHQAYEGMYHCCAILLTTSRSKAFTTVEGLNHNLFSVGQFCDADLSEVAFRKSQMTTQDILGHSFYVPRMKTKVLKDFLTTIQRNLQAPVISVRTDRGTEFLNKTLNAFFKEEGIEHQTSTPRTPEQNGVVRKTERTLVEAASNDAFSFKLRYSFGWKLSQACYTQNRSIIIPTHEKNSNHIVNDETSR
ncbi:retrovirus-related pol polyprotein from transposon TNT 1-94 [Tanacetum coccineum]